MANFYQVTKEINGTEYTAQFNGISAAEDAIDNCGLENCDAISNEKFAKYLFDNVIVSPKVKINDFGADKIGKTEKKVIGGVEYVAVFNGMLAALRIQDSSYTEGTSKLSQKKFAKNLFDKVIVTPEELTADDFNNIDDYNEVIKFARDTMQGGKEIMDEYNEVTRFARDVMHGRFQEEANTKSTSTKSKK